MCTCRTQQLPSQGWVLAAACRGLGMLHSWPALVQGSAGSGQPQPPRLAAVVAEQWSGVLAPCLDSCNVRSFGTPSSACSLPLCRVPRASTLQLLESTGVPAYTAASAAINASQAALPNPLLDVTLAAEVQLQALQAYQAATTWVVNATTNATG